MRKEFLDDLAVVATAPTFRALQCLFDEALSMAQGDLETASKPENIYRLQGAISQVRAFQKLFLDLDMLRNQQANPNADPVTQGEES